MHSFSLTKTLAALSCSLALVACGPPDEANRANTGPINGPFVVSDYFTPSGLMGDGETPGLVTVAINKECGPLQPDGTRQPREPGALGDCYHFVHHIGERRWSGAYWVFPANSWGTVPGRAVIGPVDLGPDANGIPLRGYTRVRFRAAIDPLPTAPDFNAFVGGIDGSTAMPPRPYSDEACRVRPADPADPTSMRTVSCGKFRRPLSPSDIIENHWRQYSISVEGFGVDALIGAFGWSINDNQNLGQTISMYFDDIVWE